MCPKLKATVIGGVIGLVIGLTTVGAASWEGLWTNPVCSVFGGNAKYPPICIPPPPELIVANLGLALVGLGIVLSSAVALAHSLKRDFVIPPREAGA